MSQKKDIVRPALFFPALFLMVGLFGCAGAEIVPEIPGKPGVLYLPTPRPGATFESAKAELSALASTNPLNRKVWLTRPHDESVKDSNATYISFKEIAVGPDRIEFLAMGQRLFVVWYEDLADSEIFVKLERNHVSVEYTVAVSRLAGGSFHARSMDSAKRFADALVFLQQEEKKILAAADAQMAGFVTLAAAYREAAVKPAVSEEQRMYIVQANALGQQKDYAGALERYGKVVGVDPVAYPEAWFNMALLSAQQGRYRAAIGFMKRYLMLVPDAKDARAAQDKIYEWDFLRQKR